MFSAPMERGKFWEQGKWVEQNNSWAGRYEWLHIPPRIVLFVFFRIDTAFNRKNACITSMKFQKSQEYRTSILEKE